MYLQERKSKIFSESNVFVFIFLFTILSGAMRKWVFSDQLTGNVIFGIQLIIPFLFLSCGWRKVSSMYHHTIFILYLLLLAGEAFNPLNLSWVHGTLGFLIHSAFWFAMYYYITNRHFFKFDNFGIIAAVAFLMLILVYVQYSLPPDHILNKYVDEKKVSGISTVGDRVRVTGTFSYIGGFSSYLIFHVFFVWALIRRNFSPLLIAFLLAGGLIAAFMSGSRGATFSYILIVILMTFKEYKTLEIGSMLSRIFLPICIIGTVLLLVGDFNITDNLSAAYQNFENRRISLKESGEEQSRLLWDINQIIDFRGKYPIFGVGLGATYQGAIAIMGESEYVKEYGYYESELARYILEGGFLLLFFKVILSIDLLSKLYLPRIVKVFFLIMLFNFYFVVFNVYNAVFAFLSIMVLEQSYLNTAKRKLPL